MCDCGLITCSFCYNPLNEWVRWSCYVEQTLAKHKPHTRDELDLRLGQKLFNALWSYRADIADKIRGSIIDPFHNDNNIPAFLEKVDELWTV